MKKLAKVIGILIAIGAVVAAVLLYLKKMGFFDDCDMDCENCDKDCMNEDEEECTERGYVNIQTQPACEACEEAAEEACESCEETAEEACEACEETAEEACEACEEAAEEKEEA